LFQRTPEFCEGCGSRREVIVNPQVRAQTIGDVVRLVEAHEVELGVVPEQTTVGGVNFEPLFEYRWFLVAPLGHPVLRSRQPSVAEISQWPVIVRRRRAALNAWAVLEELFRDQDLTYRIVLELDQMDSIKRYVSTGMGISLLPEFAIELTDLRRLSVRDMTHLFPEETAGFLSPKTLHPSPAATNFVKSLKSAVSRRQSRPRIIEWQHAGG
jgi:DNA-binding transcriptional LysR family regulator